MRSKTSKKAKPSRSKTSARSVRAMDSRPQSSPGSLEERLTKPTDEATLFLLKVDIGQFENEDFFRILITLHNGSQVISNARFTSIEEASDFWKEMSKSLNFEQLSIH